MAEIKLAAVNKPTAKQLVSWDIDVRVRTIWPTDLLAAFGGHLLATLSVAGVSAHWINTTREIKQVISTVHGKAVPPHYSAKVRTKENKIFSIASGTKAALAGVRKTSCANKGQTVWGNLWRDTAKTP